MTDTPTVCKHCERRITQHPVTGTWVHAYNGNIYCVKRYQAAPAIGKVGK